jgi:hypothetical protein
LVVEDTQYKANEYGFDDRYKPQYDFVWRRSSRLLKAMALAELITTRYPKDTLDILVFGNDAWPIDIKILPYLKSGTFH